jgi:hypothetical protein
MICEKKWTNKGKLLRNMGKWQKNRGKKLSDRDSEDNSARNGKIETIFASKKLS